jgi:hypothetical protein
MPSPTSETVIPVNGSEVALPQGAQDPRALHGYALALRACRSSSTALSLK